MILLLINLDGFDIEVVLLRHATKIFIVISNLIHYIIVFLNVLTEPLYFKVAVLQHESIVYCFRDFWLYQVHIFKIPAVFLLLLFLTFPLVVALLVSI